MNVVELEKEYVMQTFKRYGVVLTRGKGSRVWDSDGKEYLDMLTGIAVCSLGHCHPAVVSAIKEQSEKLMHCSNYFYIESQVELAKLLAEISPFDSCKTFFCNSGTEAVEAAIKLCRKHTKKTDIVAMHNSFHGRTMGSLAITDKESYQKPFLPLMPGVKFANFNDLDSVKEQIDEKTAAIFVEPVQSEGGVHLANKEFLKGLRDLCDDKNILLVFDEVQTGFGRTGENFAAQYYDVVPDMMTLAKAMGGGFPIAALVAKSQVANAFEAGDHGGTLGGSPLACAVSKAAVEENIKLCNNVKDVGGYLSDKLNELKEKHSEIKDVRSIGLLVGVEVENADEIRKQMLEDGVIVNVASGNVIRFLPALNVTKEEIDEALGAFEKALSL